MQSQTAVPTPYASSQPSRSTISGSSTKPIRSGRQLGVEPPGGMCADRSPSTFIRRGQVPCWSPVGRFEAQIQADARLAAQLQDEEYSRRRRRRREPPRKDCAICGDSCLISDLPSASGCSHEPENCHSCFSTWVNTQLDSTTWDRVKCPTSGCEVLLQHNDIKLFAEPAVYDR